MKTPSATLSSEAGTTSGGSPDASEPRFQIGTVAERTALSHHTLRHWDEAGLVSPSGRSEGGFRLYSEADIQRILVIRRMKPLGFTLEQMQQLLDAFEVLRAPGSTAVTQAEAGVVLRACALQAQQSLERLQRHLAYAEEFQELVNGLLRAAEA